MSAPLVKRKVPVSLAYSRYVIDFRVVRLSRSRAVAATRSDSFPTQEPSLLMPSGPPTCLGNKFQAIDVNAGVACQLLKRAFARQLLGGRLSGVRGGGDQALQPILEVNLQQVPHVHAQHQRARPLTVAEFEVVVLRGLPLPVLATRSLLSTKIIPSGCEAPSRLITYGWSMATTSAWIVRLTLNPGLAQVALGNRGVLCNRVVASLCGAGPSAGGLDCQTVNRPAPTDER